VPLFFSCVSGAELTAEFKTTGGETVLTFGGLTAGGGGPVHTSSTGASIPKGLVALVGGESTFSATFTCDDATPENAL